MGYIEELTPGERLRHNRRSLTAERYADWLRENAEGTMEVYLRQLTAPSLAKDVELLDQAAQDSEDDPLKAAAVRVFAHVLGERADLAHVMELMLAVLRSTPAGRLRRAAQELEYKMLARERGLGLYEPAG